MKWRATVTASLSLAVVLALALTPALALAATEPPARAASLLVYHVSPDPRAGTPEADPLSAPGAPSPPSARLPFTLIDGIEPTDPAPEGRPESALSHFREMQRLVGLRRSTGAPFAITLDVDVAEGRAEARVVAEPAPGARTPPARLRLVLFEDGAPLTTDGGARSLRYVVRAALAVGNVTPDANVTASFTLAPEWQRARLGVAAIVEDEAGVALQSATWIPGGGATRSGSKMVLVEHVTATWCAPCEPADEAFALLASQVGVFDDAGASGLGYLRPPTALLGVGLFIGAAFGVVVLRRRAA